MRSWQEHEYASLWYSLVCFTQGDYVMLISHMKGYDERKLSYNPKRDHDHVYTGS